MGIIDYIIEKKNNNIIKLFFIAVHLKMYYSVIDIGYIRSGILVFTDFLVVIFSP